MDQYIGKLLDNRYELLELIGVGGMAKVYKARCHRLNRLVAVKILRDDMAQDAEFRRRFHDESHAVAMLSHPNIMSVYDVSRNSELEYIVMELIDGITLKQYMEKKGNKLSWRESLHFITQIVKALGHAHSRGIIHRDIKPHNIMVLRDGSIKVADFGIARLMSSGHSTLTQEALGSVHYISPEQARGSRIDARSDLYSAGVVLYEMTTGRLPFEGDSPVSVAIQHINSIPLSPRDLNPEIPEALEAITMRAMAPNPDDRYISADAMLADLEEFRKNPDINFDYNVNVSDFQSIISEAQAEEYPDEKTQILTVGSITGTRGKGDTAARGAVRITDDEVEEEEEEEEDRRGPVWPIFVAVLLILGFIAGVFYFLYTSFLQDLLTPSPSYTIPSLVGKVYEEVVDDAAVLQDFGLTIGSAVNSPEPAGTILSQSPNAGTGTQNPNTNITVTISSGPEVITMPDLKNMEYYKALVALQNMGLVVKTPQYQNHEEVAADRIISFSPAQGTVMDPGDEVELVVSKGPVPVTVPSLIGRTEKWALDKIEDLGLTVGEVKQVYSSEYKEGVVVHQSIDSGTEVPSGSLINLQISKGVDPATIPTSYTYTFNIDMPSDPVTIRVKVVKDGAVVLNQSVDCSSTQKVACTVKGTGTQVYEIYFDDVFQYRETVDFDLVAGDT